MCIYVSVYISYHSIKLSRPDVKFDRLPSNFFSYPYAHPVHVIFTFDKIFMKVTSILFFALQTIVEQRKRESHMNI